ncbi:hypothetical protein ZWY2020_010812 [Hordeum vulgare]|nr:hypothetical protein ZWY2020_010812 [Hordeum vulgare]
MSKKRFKNRSTSPQNIEVDSDSESVLTPEPEQEELEEEEVTAADDLSLLDRIHNGGLPHVLRDSDDDDAFIDDSDDHDAFIDPRSIYRRARLLLVHVLKDGGKGRKHSAAPSSSACDGMGTRGRGRGRAVAATPSEVAATRSPPPPQADSPEHRTSRVDSSEVEATRFPFHEPRVNEPQVDEPSTHKTRVPEASFQATPEQSRDEGTSQETQWNTWAEPSGHAGSDEELGEGATVYQRGSSGLPLVPATPEQSWSIRPNGDKVWIVAKGVRKPNIILGVLCRKNFPGFVTLPGPEREVGMTWEHSLGAPAPPEVEIDRVLCDTRADMVIRKFWTYYRCEEGYEEDVAKVIETECRRLLQNFRHEARVQAVRGYYAMWRIRLDKAKCRDAKMGKEHYMKARHSKKEAPQMYDLYAMAHTASYKKVKAFSESDLEHRENFTNISSHHNLVKYRDHGNSRKGEDFNPSERLIDPELVMIAGNGRPQGSIAIGDGLIRCPSTLRQIKARQTSSCPEITRRPRPVEFAIELQKGIVSQFSPKKGTRGEERKEEEEEEEKKKKKEKEKEKKEENKEKELLLLLLLPPSSSFSFSFLLSSSSPLPSPSPPPPSFTSSSLSLLLRSLDSSKKG